MMNKKAPMPKSSGKDSKAGAMKKTEGMKKIADKAPMKPVKKSK